MRSLRTLLANRRLQLLLVLLIPTALFFCMRAQLSWRPRVLGQVKGEVSAIAWSPNGKWLATVTTLEAPAAPIEIWNVSQRKLQGRIKTKAGFNNFLQFSADSRTLSALDGTWVLRHWSVLDKSELQLSPLTINPLGFALSPDGSTIVQCETGIVGRRVSDGKNLWTLDDAMAVVALARFSPDGKRLALLMWQTALVKGAALVVWNLDSAKNRTKPEKIISVKPYHVKSYGLIYVPDKDLAYLLGGFGEIFCYDLQAQAMQARFDPEGRVESKGFKSSYWGDYAHVASIAPPGMFAQVAPESATSSQSTIQLREWPSGKIQRVLRSKNKTSSFRLPTFSPDGDTLAAVDDKGFITLWRIK